MKDSGISLAEAAQQCNVTTASVRNWIRTGYLDTVARNVISTASFEVFRQNVAGSEKLVARANKLLKDLHRHEEVLCKFSAMIKDSKTDSAVLAYEYENALSNAYRNKEGIYYTAPAIVERFFQHLPRARSKLTFCDPCCGSGNFILAAIKHGINLQNIYGFDTDPLAIELTRKRVYEQTGKDMQGIQQGDFLEFSLKEGGQSFDIVFTNPPWGKKISSHKKKSYAKRLGAGTSTDSSALFFFACLLRLNKDGYLGLLLPEAFFNVASFEKARKKALSLTIRALMDLGKPFKNLMTGAKGMIVQQRNCNIRSQVFCELPRQSLLRRQSSFSENPRSIVNFTCNSNDARIIGHIYKQAHLKLSGHARFALGIVTGNNKKFCAHSPQKGYLPVYTGTDLHKNSISSPRNFIPKNFSLYQQVASPELYMAKEKILYRFISSKLVFYYDVEQRLFLNSVNMLVVDSSFPLSARQTCQILNSSVINWLFQAVFGTCKVLRSDIEALPIHAGYFNSYAEFSEEQYLDFLGIEKDGAASYRIKTKAGLVNEGS